VDENPDIPLTKAAIPSYLGAQIPYTETLVIDKKAYQ